MLDFSLDKVVVICVIAVLVVGPKRLPEYAAKLARLVRSFRGMVDGVQARMRDELGPEYRDIDWKKLDPRQYDPRQIVRDSLMGVHEPASEPAERVPNPFDDLPVAAGHDHVAGEELDSRATTRKEPT